MRRLLSILPLLLIALAPVRAANTEELLEPDKAFRFSARALDAATVEVRYAIADGYYLYRERFRFAAEPSTVRLGKPRFCRGPIPESQCFAKRATCPKEFAVARPLERAR